jgi:hypothetical protein
MPSQPTGSMKNSVSGASVIESAAEWRIIALVSGAIGII